MVFGIDIAGIVLIGGKSKRMGYPKALMEYDGDLLYHKTALLIEDYVDKVFISGTTRQFEYWDIKDYDFIHDLYKDIGPIGGIVSAFEHLKAHKCALLTVATDMPFLNESTISQLIFKRNKSKKATIYRNADSGFLEPLCAIYEFDALEIILKALSKNCYAIHRVFDENDMEFIDFDKKKPLTNINYPDQLDLLKGD